jgi:hypothetical protein
MPIPTKVYRVALQCGRVWARPRWQRQGRIRVSVSLEATTRDDNVAHDAVPVDEYPILGSPITIKIARGNRHVRHQRVKLAEALHPDRGLRVHIRLMCRELNASALLAPEPAVHERDVVQLGTFRVCAASVVREPASCYRNLREVGAVLGCPALAAVVMDIEEGEIQI